MRPATLVATTLLGAVLTCAASAGELAGRIELAVEGVQLADVGPIVVYLEPRDGARVPAPSSDLVVIRQNNVQFVPDFVAVAAGQRVSMPNDDSIFHNVFSMSRPNDFDLGVYPQGETRIVELAAPGFVRIYCSIHESMYGAIFVAPTPWFDRASISGEYRIADVPAGRYLVRVWSERMSGLEREVTVGSTGSTTLNLMLGAPGP